MANVTASTALAIEVSIAAWATKNVPVLEEDAAQMWMIIAGALVLFMQAGFSLLEAGAVRSKNVVNILFKNIMDAAIGCIVFFFVGWGLTGLDGPGDGMFMGTAGGFALSGSENFAPFFFQFAFAATAATIVSGCVAERLNLDAYFVYSIMLTGLWYPIVVHWAWDSEGFLVKELNYMDFAGSGVVHMVGGWTGIVGAMLLGPRTGRFDSDVDDSEFAPNNVPNLCVGTLILWFGWLGFNPGSTAAVAGSMSTAARAAATTCLAASCGAVTACMSKKYVTGVYSVPATCNGLLAGLVAITASCNVVDPGSACFIGVIGAVVSEAASSLLIHYEIDDPLDAFAVHGASGFWGVVATGIFITEKSLGDVSRTKQIGNQLLGAMIIALWSSSTALVTFKLADYTVGLRCDAKMELEGLDISEHGGKAYMIFDNSSQNSSPFAICKPATCDVSISPESSEDEKPVEVAVSHDDKAYHEEDPPARSSDGSISVE